MELSVILNYVFGFYGAILTTYTGIKAVKEKKRKVSINVSTRWQWSLPDGKRSSELLLITVINSGGKKVKVNTPYLELPDGKSLVTPVPMIPISFPRWLPVEDSFTLPMQMNDVKANLIELGFKGIVKLRGNITDATEHKYTSKKSCDFNIDEEYK